MDIAEKNSLMLLVIHVGAQIRFVLEDLDEDFCEDTGVGAESGRDVFALGEEAYCSLKEALKQFWLDELAKT
jgi:hypothetical protein